MDGGEVHPELEPEAPPQISDLVADLGASPVLGPVTRSGKKRKHAAPVKSSGKKKTKMIRSPGTAATRAEAPASAASKAGQSASTTNDKHEHPVVPASPVAREAPLDIAKLLATAMSDIKTSMGGMEARLGG